MFGVRFADGWVERSTSSGSSCVEVESVGGVGAFDSIISNLLNKSLRLENGGADEEAYPVGFVCQKGW